MRKLSVSILLIPIVALLSWGCGAKVKATRMVPAKYQVAGIKTLAVADFESGNTGWSRSGPYLADLVRDEFEGATFYPAIEAAPAFGADDSFDDGWRRWCAKHKVDAIVAGTVRRASVESRTEYRKEEKEVKTGKYKYETYYEGGQQKKRRVEIVEKRIERIPVVEKKAQLEVQIALIDARAGIKLDSDSISKSDSEQKEGEDIRYIPSDSDMLETLARVASSQIANNLAPHPATESIKLASDGDCKEGAKLAQKGEWNAAIESWKAVLAADPENHSALYDLGVAAEVAKDYRKAETYYLKALDLKDKSLYRKALQRAGKRLREKERLKEQMEGRQ